MAEAVDNQDAVTRLAGFVDGLDVEIDQAVAESVAFFSLEMERWRKMDRT